MFVSHLAIHFPWQTPEDEGHREEGKRYRDVSGSLSKLGTHPPDETGRVVRRMIEEMDKSIGRILSKVQELGLDQRTLVLFASDNGGITQYRGGYYEISSNGPLSGGKGSVYEGGHRMPAIARWPGRIKAGSVTDDTVLTMDVLPTLLELANVEGPQKESPNTLDGVSILPLLIEGKGLCLRTVFWRKGRNLAARSGDWKIVVPENDQPQLYNLDQDISESHDIAEQHQERANKLMAELAEWNQQVTTQ